MTDHAPEKTVAIDVAFGAIRFVREKAATFAHVAVDVTIVDLSSGSETETENKVQMMIKFSAEPESETVVAIVDKARGRIIERLRSAANIVETKSAAALLFGGDG